MAWGLTPKYSEDYTITDINPQQFIAQLVISAEALGWEVNYISDKGIIAYTNKGMLSANGLITVVVEDRTANIRSEATGSEVYDMGRNKKNVRSLTEAISNNTNTSEELNERYKVLKEDFPSDEDDVLAQPPESTQDKLKSALSLFIPTKGYFITPILIDINILIFIFMALSGVNIIAPDSESLLQWGANFRPMTLDGQPWRFLTSCFVHIGVLHLLMNMYALLYIGVLIEHRLGPVRFLSAYILSGVAASVTSTWWHDLTVSAGASGAIFGMYGLFLAMLTTNLIEKSQRKALLTSIGVFVFYNLINGMRGGIDNAAHIGGLVSGMIIGYTFVLSFKKNASKQLTRITLAGLTILTLSFSLYAYKNIPNDIGKLQASMTEFAKLEERALSFYELSENSTYEERLDNIEKIGIPTWEQCINLIEKADQLNLPIELKTRNEKLRNYCELRIKVYRLTYKSIKDDTNKYDEELEEYYSQISTIIETL